MAPLFLRATVPFAWLLLPATSISYPYNFLVVLACYGCSLLLQPITTILVSSVIGVLLTISYLSKKPFKAFPLRTTITGKKDGQVMVLIHGWPDCSEVWKENVAAFEERYRVVTIDLPQHHPESPRGENSWGYDCDELAECILVTIKGVVEGGETSSKQAPIVVGHDWGSVLAHLFAYRFPSMVERLVLLDVTLEPDKTMPLSYFFKMGMGYQYFNVFLFLLDKVPLLGPPVATLILSQSIRKSLLFRTAVPYTWTFSAQANYLYFYVHLRRIQVSLGLIQEGPQRYAITREQALLMPVLFVYAADKKARLHSWKFCKMISERNDKSKVVTLGEEWKKQKGKKKTKVGHWLQYRAAKDFNTIVLDWLSSFGKAAAPSSYKDETKAP